MIGWCYFELLQYRDQLILAGWNQTITDISLKIDLLWPLKLRMTFHKVRRQMEEGSKHIQIENTVSLGFSKIILHESATEMNPFFKLLFNL